MVLPLRIVGHSQYLACNDKGEIIGGLNTIEEIEHYIKTNSNSKSLENLAKYLKPSLEKLCGFSMKFPNEKPTKDILEESKY